MNCHKFPQRLGSLIVTALFLFGCSALQFIPQATATPTPLPPTVTPTATLAPPTATPAPPTVTPTVTPTLDPLLPTPSFEYPTYGYLGKEVGEAILRGGIVDGISFRLDGKRCYAPSSALVGNDIKYAICPMGSPSRVTGYEYLGEPGAGATVTLTYDDSPTIKEGYAWKRLVTITIVFDSNLSEEKKAQTRARLLGMFVGEGIRGEIDGKDMFFDSSTQTLYLIGEYGKLEPFEK